jgi:hypothetical protein
VSNVTYSFVQNSEGQLAFESKATSFGIDHTTKKDLKSFYVNFSSKAYFDTGLIPVDGSGLLSIRTAGNHTQIAYQHKPGMYYINWGAHERDPNAAKIYVAQPYRIVIADIYNGNILGARTFYSPIPIQYPQAPLYHVNLPNINCRGYRGNGVGWICLYHTEDISAYPFSEKLAKILERCSGVEAYNDANMSETDGPRFYKDHGKPSFLWNPQEWEVYSEKNEFTWTLDPDLWIPVLVQDLDHQDKHVNDGVPLTFADAILGNYQAYYTDPIKPKLINKISRNDLEVTNDDIFNLFKMSYNSSLDYGLQMKNKNTMESSMQVREQLSQVFVAPPQASEDEEDEDDHIGCDACGESINVNLDEYTNSYHGEAFCGDCTENMLVWVEHLDAYVRQDDKDLKYSNSLEQYYYLQHWKEVVECPHCTSKHIYDTEAGYTEKLLPIWHRVNDSVEIPVVCENCLDDLDLMQSCAFCHCNIPDSSEYIVNTMSSHYTGLAVSKVCNQCFYENTSALERSGILTPHTLVTCICGENHEAGAFSVISANSPFAFKNFGFSSGIGNLIKVNAKIASNYAVFEHKVKESLADVALSVSVKTQLVCPECKLQSYDGHGSEYFKHYQNNVEQKLIKIIESSGSLDMLYGTYVNIYSTF